MIVRSGISCIDPFFLMASRFFQSGDWLWACLDGYIFYVHGLEGRGPSHGFTALSVIFLSAQCSVSRIQSTQTYIDCQCSWAAMEVLGLW